MASLLGKISRKLRGGNEQKTRSIRPRFGIMRLEETPSTFAESLALMLRSVDYRLIYFRPEDVDVRAGKVNGLAYNGYKWVSAQTDIPFIVDVNPEVLAQAAEQQGVVELLKQRSYLTDDGGFVSNVDLQEALAQDPNFASCAVQTLRVNFAQDILNYLDQHGVAVLKPNVPGAGKVRLLRKAEDGSIQMGVDQAWETMDAVSFQKRMDAAVQSEEFVIQEYIASPSKLGDPFVCHVHAEKDGRNGWHVVRKYVRVGIGQCVSSNYADGGRSGYEPFIKACRPEQHEAIVDAINTLAAQFPYKYENLRGTRLVSVGFDLSVGENGEVRVLSVDASPCTRHYHAEAARWRMPHYFWLLDYVAGKDAPFAPREPWNDPAQAHARAFRRTRFQKLIQKRAEEKRPYIGILSNRIDAIGTCRIIAMFAAGRGMDVVFFLPKDVDMDRNVINAYGLEGLDWVQKERPIPEVVNIASILYESTDRYAKLIAYLRERSHMTDDDSVRVNKEDMQMLLTGDSFFKQFALETKHVANADVAVDFLDECPDAVIKPVGGMRGVGVYRIKRREDGMYEVGMYTDLQVMDREAFRAYVEETFVNPRHIIQEYVSSRSKDGDPFDCRVHVEKNRKGDWQLARAYIRVGIGQQIISNVNQGGNIVEAEPFLKMHRPDCWQQIMEGLNILAATMPYKFENLKGRNLVSIGFDVGIDQNGGLHVFEVNTFPAIGFILAETALLKSAYYRWVYKHMVEDGEQFQPREPWKKIVQAKNRQENILAVAAATGWDQEKAQEEVAKASKLGVTSGQYLRKHCWDLNDDELKEMGEALEAYKPIRAANNKFYLDHVCRLSGWSPKEAKARMDDAKENLGISRLKFAQKACWTLSENEMKRLARLLELDAERIRANKDRYIKEIMAANNWTWGKVELEVAKAKVICEASYEDYYAFKMYELTPEEQAKYVTLGQFNKMRLKYNWDREKAVAVFDDKAGFNRTFADLISRKWFVNTGLSYEQCMEEIAGLDAVLVKPLAATQGIGIQKFQVNVSEEGNREFYDTLMSLGESIVEQYVIQHDEMMGFCPTSVNTVRVTTLNFNGECKFLYSVFRMGRGNVVDNFHAGGIAATVDVETGIVMTDAADLDSNTFATSPMTGKVIKGFQIPNWDCIRETCAKGSGRIEGVNLIGWDFAITPDGVDLIEGNPGASYVVAQIPNVKDRIGLYDQMVKPYL